MNTATLLIIWMIFYPASVEFSSLCIAARKMITEQEQYSKDVEYRFSKIYWAVYIIVIIILWYHAKF